MKLVKDEIIRVKLEQLLPAIPEVQEIHEEDEDDEDKQDHLDLSAYLKEFKNLKELDLSVKVKDVGMNFEWGFFTVNNINKYRTIQKP